MDEAFSPPQVQLDFPAFTRHATGEVLDTIRQNAEDALEANEAYRIPEGAIYEHRAEVVSLEDTTATVRDCNLDDTVAVDMTTGAVVDDTVYTIPASTSACWCWRTASGWLPW